jgi:putative transcriptional regulator
VQKEEQIVMKKVNQADELIQAMSEAVDYMRGQDNGAITHEIRVPDKIDVAKIRKEMGLSRPRFAERFGFRPKTLQHWEQGDRKPSGPARILLAILDKDPDIFDRYFHVNDLHHRRKGKNDKKEASV